MSIALVSVKDFDISEKYIINGNISIYPKHSLDTSIIQGCKFDFIFEELKDTFYDTTIIAFPIFFPQRRYTRETKKLMKKELDGLNGQTAKGEIVSFFAFLFFWRL